jgi:hypothetical protein
MTTARVGVDITAQDRTSAAFMSASRTIQKFGSVAGSALKGFGTGLASAALIRGLNATITRMDDMTAAAKRMGESTESLSRLAYAAQLSELPFETLLQTSKKLNENLADIGAGKGGEAEAAMKALGLSAYDVFGKLKSVDQVIVDVAGKFSLYKDGANKAALASAIFGQKAGPEMIPMLNGGAKAIADAKAEADAFGLTLSGSASEAASTFNDNMDRMSGFVQGVAQTVVSAFLPAVNEMIEKFIATGDAGRIAQAGIDGIYGAVETASTGMQKLATVMGYLDQAKAASAYLGRDLNRFIVGDEAGREEALRIYKQQTAEIWKRSEALENVFTVTMSGPGKGSLPSATPAFEAPSFVRPGGGGSGGRKSNKSNVEKIDPLLGDAERIFASARTPMEAHMARVAELDKLMNKGYITQETWNRSFAESQSQYVSAAGALNQFTAEAETSIGPLQQVSDLIQNKFTSGLDLIIDRTARVGQAFKSMATGMLQDATKMFAHRALQQLFQPEHALYGGGGGGVASLLGSLFGGFRADGGGVSSGRGYVVGERGPEWFEPGADGYITPNHALGGGGSSNITIIDQRSNAPAIEQRSNGDGSISLLVRDAVRNELPGALRKTMPAQYGLQPSMTRR